jgi:hypothetical protein
MISASCLSQDFYKVKKSILQVHNGVEWVDKKVLYPESMFIIVKDSEIKITNKSESKYITYGDVKEKRFTTHKTYIWDAYNEDGRDCLFMMKISNGETNDISFNFVFGDITYEYIAERQ